MGCKRVLISNDFYPAFERDNVDLVTEPIERIERRGIRTIDGRLHELDVLISATGFYVTDNPWPRKFMASSASLWPTRFDATSRTTRARHFRVSPTSSCWAAPTRRLGHTSIIFMMEAQLNYAVRAIKVALATDSLIEPKLHVARRWTRDVQVEVALNSVGHRMFELVHQFRRTQYRHLARLHLHVSTGHPSLYETRSPRSSRADGQSRLSGASMSISSVAPTTSGINDSARCVADSFVDLGHRLGILAKNVFTFSRPWPICSPS